MTHLSSYKFTLQPTRIGTEDKFAVKLSGNDVFNVERFAIVVPNTTFGDNQKAFVYHFYATM